jgi:hypothetical protein
MIALYRNGERIMPASGYPMRLLLPGWEGNMNKDVIEVSVQLPPVAHSPRPVNTRPEEPGSSANFNPPEYETRYDSVSDRLRKPGSDCRRIIP